MLGIGRLCTKCHQVLIVVVIHKPLQIGKIAVWPSEQGGDARAQNRAHLVCCTGILQQNFENAPQFLSHQGDGFLTTVINFKGIDAGAVSWVKRRIDIDHAVGNPTFFHRLESGYFFYKVSMWVNDNNAVIRVLFDQFTIQQNFYEFTLPTTGRGDDISVSFKGVEREYFSHPEIKGVQRINLKWAIEPFKKMSQVGQYRFCF